MTQPKLSGGTRALLDYHGFRASLYQPTHLFVSNRRKLPNCPEPGDPWECFLRRDDGSFGVVARAIGPTPDDATLAALYLRPGLKPALLRLGRAVDDLVEALRAR